MKVQECRACVSLCGLVLGAAFAGAQVGGDPHAVHAKRVYAEVFAHPEQPCPWHDNASDEDCIGKELQFTEEHLDAFVATLRILAAGVGQGQRSR